MARILALLLVSLTAGVAHAKPAIAVEPLENIRAAAGAFVAAQTGAADRDIDVEVGRLDPRLRLARCDAPLASYYSPGARATGHTTVGVRCEGTRPWTLFVPVTVTESKNVVVSARALARGQVVGADDILTERRRVGAAATAYVEDPEAVLGKVLTRAISAKTALSPQLLKAPRLVRRGQRVQVAWDSGPVSVRMSGTALRDGARGDLIQVRNLNSKRVVEGVIDGPGSIVVRDGSRI